MTPIRSQPAEICGSKRPSGARGSASNRSRPLQATCNEKIMSLQKMRNIAYTPILADPNRTTTQRNLSNPVASAVHRTSGAPTEASTAWNRTLARVLSCHFLRATPSANQKPKIHLNTAYLGGGYRLVLAHDSWGDARLCPPSRSKFRVLSPYSLPASDWPFKSDPYFCAVVLHESVGFLTACLGATKFPDPFYTT